MYNAFPTTSLYNPVTTGYGFGYSQQKQEVIKVNGQNGAQAFQLSPNSSVLLLDSTQPVIYLKQTDGGGYANITAYKIEPVQTERIESDIERRLKKLEEIIYESDTSNVKQSKPTQSACAD